MAITDEYMVKGYYRHYDGMSLLKHALHNTCPDMMKSIGEDEHGNDIKVRDSEGIQLANAKIDEIRNGFTEWLGGEIRVERYGEGILCALWNGKRLNNKH